MSELATVTDLAVRYGRRTALDGVSLAFADDGKVIGLFGRNGAGKSTLIRVLCGLIGRYSGEVDVRCEAIGYLPDEPFLYPWLRIDECIRVCDEIWSDFSPTSARTAIEQLGLSESIRVRQMSKGMSEQLHLALVLARRCRLYVFDEPLAAVDPLTRDRLIRMIKETRTPGSTVLISTHLISGLEELFDAAVVIDDGKVKLSMDTRTVKDGTDLESQIKAVLA
jgi:ABC-2 type transport system ATP-binding protein